MLYPAGQRQGRWRPPPLQTEPAAVGLFGNGEGIAVIWLADYFAGETDHCFGGTARYVGTGRSSNLEGPGCGRPRCGSVDAPRRLVVEQYPSEIPSGW